ncbi:hypothetical protein DCD74_03575 [Lysobacter oculi]|uniref:Uncharacterized protein n=1 Tax=Solilutibacter oculi TaxID=2698682 RepID=A0A344J4D1_9GAMM|nr:hypothetical protein [Lysobacter oculi]AXA83891.1 hypothetical protein DCD74_03575 [Lysobacter oculi]
MRRASILGAALVLLALAGCDLLPASKPEFKLQNTHAPGSALHDSTQLFIDGFNNDPELQQHFAETFSKDGMYAEMPRAISRGAQSLDAATVQDAVGGMKRAITSLEPADCAAFFRPESQRVIGMGERMQRGFEKVPPKHHAALMRYYLAALKAEATNAPRVRIDPQVREQAFQHLTMQYTGPAAERINRVMSYPAGASDEDLCWMGNSLLNGMEKLGDREREAATRTLLGH